MTVGSLERRFLIHLPKNYNSKKSWPLLLVFHGQGGTGRISEKAGFSDIADREGFIVVYPNGINKTWLVPGNPGYHPDEITFVEKLIDALISDYNIDKSRVYATGHSVGGFFSIWLATQHADIFAAVASVSGGMYEGHKMAFAPTEPVSILLMNGTKDTVVPFHKSSGSKDWIMDSFDVLGLWIKHNGCNAQGTIEKLPNIAKDDVTIVLKATFSGGKRGTEVVFYAISGGKHRLPTQNKEIISYKPGHCRDIDAAEEIWKFFSHHQKVPGTK